MTTTLFQVIWTATINGHHGVDCIQDLNTPHLPTWEGAAAAIREAHPDMTAINPVQLIRYRDGKRIPLHPAGVRV